MLVDGAIGEAGVEAAAGVRKLLLTDRASPRAVVRILSIATVALALLAPSLAYAQAGANYVTAEDGVYFYQPALTEEERRRGVATAYLSGFRYYGRDTNGEHVIVAVDQYGRAGMPAHCGNPCRVIRFDDGRRLLNRNNLLLGSVFEDAAAGRLQNTHPDLMRVYVPSTSPVGEVTPESVSRTDFGSIIIRAEANAPVYPPAPGLIIESGRYGRYGNYVKIDHGGDFTTIVGHLGEAPNLRGQFVRGDSILGRVGCNDDCSEGFVIFEVRIEGEPVNPVPFIVASPPDASSMEDLFELWEALESN